MDDQTQSNTVATAIGEVQTVTGRVIAIGADGVERTLVAGDPVFADDLIKTIGESAIVVVLNDGTRFDLGRDGEALLEESVFTTDVESLRTAAEAEIAELQDLIAAGADPVEITAEPAAGGEDSSAAESVQSAQDVARTARIGAVEAGFETSGQGRDADPLLADAIDFGASGSADDGVLGESNEAPEVSDVIDRATEDGAVVTGSVAVSDPDGDRLSYSLIGPAPQGLTFDNATGEYSFDPADPAYNGLKDGETADVVIPYQVNGDPGGAIAANLIITLTGTNDAPVVDDVSDSATEGGTKVSGSVAVSDPDGDPLRYDLSGPLPPGLTFDSNSGEYSFDPTDPAYDGLQAGETIDVVLPYEVIGDPEGPYPASLTITLTGTNDAPLVSDVTDNAIEDGALLNGSVAVTDPDGDTLSYRLTTPPPAGLTFDDTTGSYTFDPTDAAYNGLKAGETLEVVVPYEVTGDPGGPQSANLVITVTGTNDAPSAVDDPSSTGTAIAFALGTLAPTGTVGQWGEIQPDGTLQIASGNLTGSIVGYENDNQRPIRFDSRDGIEVGGGEINLDESVEIQFDQQVSNVNVTLDSLGGRFQNEEARVGWSTFDDNGDLVGTGAFWGASDKPNSVMETYSVDSPPFSSIRIEIVDATREANFTVKAIDGDAIFDAFAATEDTSITFSIADDLLANDMDPDGDEIEFLAADPDSAVNGSIDVDADNGLIVFTPDADYFGPASFTYTISDGNGGVDTATVDLIITSVNDNPVITVADATFVTDEDTPLTIDASAVSVTDVEDGTITPLLSANNGTVAFDAEGNIVYIPDPDWAGNDVITVTATDSDGASATATLAVTVNAVNDAPVAVDDSGVADISLGGRSIDDWGTLADGQITAMQNGVAVTISNDGANLSFQTGGNFGIGAGGNEIDLGENVIFEFDKAVSNATIGLGSLGSHYNEGSSQDASVVWLAYDAEGNEVASGRVRSDADNADGDGNRTTNSIEINPPFTRLELFTEANTNSNFTVQSFSGTVEDSLTVAEDSTLVVAKESGVIDPNDTDVDGDPLEVTGVRAGADNGDPVGAGLEATGVYGTLTMNPDGSYSYVADQAAADALAPDDEATDTFVYQISDGQGGTDTAVLTITVAGTNDAPIAVDDVVATGQDAPVNINVLDNDSDPEGDTLRVTSATADNGGVIVNPDGTLDYTPDPGFNGTDTISYTVEDSRGAPSTASVVVTVNDPPVAEDDFAENRVLFGQRGGDNPGWGGVELVANSGIDGVAATVSQSGNGLGINSASNNRISQLEHRPDGSTESLTVQFGEPLLGASFGYDRLFNRGSEQGDTAEQGRWVAVFNGVDVASGTFVASAGQIADSVDIDTGGLAFDALRFEATTYVNASRPDDSSDYTVRWIEATKVDGFATTDADQRAEIDTATLLVNDSDPNGDDLTILSVDTQSASGAAVSLVDGKIIYDPNGAFEALGVGETANDWLTYSVSDGNGGTDEARVSVTVVGTGGSAIGAFDGLLVGGATGDLLVGGIGNDQLAGEGGADRFAWNAGDQGAPGLPALDTVIDFDRSEGDALDLADLLVGDPESLAEYLHFDTEVVGDITNTVVQISTTGGFTDGNFDANAVDQTIVLQGVNLSTIGSGSDEDIINALVSSNSLMT